MNSESEEAPVITTDGKLWVDKYAPSKYMDLLTDDMTNRKVMTWLKSWDDLAFNDRQKVSLKPPTIGKKYTNPFAVTTNFSKGPATIDEEFNRSHMKILMLYGPPGTGKSTLARVLAKQVGYETREINASDKRNGQELVEEIKNAITTNAHFNRTGFSEAPESKKPVCLILDEIDGALGGGSDMSKGLGFVADFLKKCMSETDRVKQMNKKFQDYEEWKADKDEEDDKDIIKEEEPEWKTRAKA